MLFDNGIAAVITIQLHFSTFWSTFCKIWLFFLSQRTISVLTRKIFHLEPWNLIAKLPDRLIFPIHISLFDKHIICRFHNFECNGMLPLPPKSRFFFSDVGVLLMRDSEIVVNYFDTFSSIIIILTLIRYWKMSIALWRNGASNPGGLYQVEAQLKCPGAITGCLPEKMASPKWRRSSSESERKLHEKYAQNLLIDVYTLNFYSIKRCFWFTIQSVWALLELRFLQKSSGNWDEKSSHGM